VEARTRGSVDEGLHRWSTASKRWCVTADSQGEEAEQADGRPCDQTSTP